MISLQLIALSLLAVVSASPLDARATCPGGPNFEGAGISILGANGFVTPNGRGHGSPAPFWHIQQTGQPNGGYIFKDIDNNNIALTRNSDGTVTMTPASNSGTDPNQQFQIVCQSCTGGASTAPPRTPIASGCNIRWIGDTSLCLQVGRAPSDDLFTSSCGSIPGAQNFSFST
ncbi:hypothetical protein Moror_7563 [Moniliophthora roreri MCA 2997]|uniref:Ricin B lectin domain-containing protein n=1 Tax=Moniliophthora roreri (strain MCA 2997) TaxID=1381753 RepID=V2WAR5_MONRO|nr:hypothetical protein Moror_7563 [Moniliophthora roreri MCA 2997]KAI3614384.1 hypothetical protein WG66_000091 [Moniliophthora roreri]